MKGDGGALGTLARQSQSLAIPSRRLFLFALPAKAGIQNGGSWIPVSASLRPEWRQKEWEQWRKSGHWHPPHPPSSASSPFS
jgi:hypothetical protein